MFLSEIFESLLSVLSDPSDEVLPFIHMFPFLFNQLFFLVMLSF